MLKRHNFFRTIFVLKYFFKGKHFIKETVSLSDCMRNKFSEANFEDSELIDQLWDDNKKEKNDLLHQAIMECQTITSVLDLYLQNKKTLTQGEKFIILRSFARLARSSKEKNFPPEFAKFIKEDILMNIPSINEFGNFFFIFIIFNLEFKFLEALDFIFFYRQFRMYNLSHYITYDNIFKFLKQIENLVVEQKFSFRNLISLYYDLNVSSMSFFAITKELVNKIKENNNLLTPFQVCFILKACSSNKFNLKSIDIFLVELAVRRFEVSSSEYDLNQKCLVFRYLASLELQFGNEKNLFPLALLMISTELQKKLQDLAENNILNIVAGFTYLPPEFNFELMHKVNEIITATIQKSNNNIDSIFMLKYLEFFNEIRLNKKWDLKRMEIFTIELANRLQNETTLWKPNFLQKIINIYFNIQSEIIVSRIKEILNKVLNENENCFFVLDFLAQHQVNISIYLDQVFIIFINKILFFYFSF